MSACGGLIARAGGRRRAESMSKFKIKMARIETSSGQLSQEPTGALLWHVVWVWCSRPRFVGAQSKEPRPSAATMRRRPAQPADPVPPARAPQSADEERSGRQLCQMHN
jgi:hypothetical protein